jgi:hypothetical protein
MEGLFFVCVGWRACVSEAKKLLKPEEEVEIKVKSEDWDTLLDSTDRNASFEMGYEPQKFNEFYTLILKCKIGFTTTKKDSIGIKKSIV